MKGGMIMTLAEKIRDLRKNKLHMSQTELAEAIGVGMRTIRSWEVDGRYPRKRETYVKLAQVLGCEVSYLTGDDVPYSPTFGETLDEGQKQADELVRSAKVLFAGGALSEDDKEEVMLALQDAFVRAKKRRREGYDPAKAEDGAEQ